MTWTEILAVLSPLLAICCVVGGYLSLRSSMAKNEAVIGERVRNALKDENELLQSRVVRVEQENKRLNSLLLLLINILKKTAGIELEIDEDIITLRTANGNVQVSRIETK